MERLGAQLGDAAPSSAHLCWPPSPGLHPHLAEDCLRIPLLCSSLGDFAPPRPLQLVLCHPPSKAFWHEPSSLPVGPCGCSLLCRRVSEKQRAGSLWPLVLVCLPVVPAAFQVWPGGSLEVRQYVFPVTWYLRFWFHLVVCLNKCLSAHSLAFGAGYLGKLSGGHRQCVKPAIQPVCSEHKTCF